MGILLVVRLTQVSIRKGSEWGSPSFPSHSSQPQALSPPEPGRKQLQPSRHLATEPTAEAPVPLSPRVTSQVTPSRRTPLPLCDPSHQANGGPQPLVSWGSLWFCLQVAGMPREMEPRNFLFFTGGQPWAGGIFVWQDTVPSFLAYV